MFGVEPVERTEGNPGHHLGDMYVGHGGGDPGVSHLLFEGEQVKAFFQQMRGKTMTKSMQCYRFDDTRLRYRLF